MNVYFAEEKNKHCVQRKHVVFLCFKFTAEGFGFFKSKVSFPA